MPRSPRIAEQSGASDPRVACALTGFHGDRRSIGCDRRSKAALMASGRDFGLVEVDAAGFDAPSDRDRHAGVWQ